MSTSIAKTQRYLPHTLETRFHAVKTYRLGWSVKFVVRRYKISKASLMRWNRRFDGTIDSLMDRSHRPKTPHPNAHTEQEKTWIKNFIRRNPASPSLNCTRNSSFSVVISVIHAPFFVFFESKVSTRKNR